MSPSGGSVVAAAPAPETDWQVVPVYWGTDRAVQPNAQRLAFGSDRARKLQLGEALVTVPKVHEVPNVERPWVVKIPYFDVTIYAEKEDPKSHFTVKEIKALTKEQLLAQVKERLGAAKLFKDQAVVFVHGYNTSFDNALYRTAQIAYDLDFDGATFLYSWPSGGAVASYTYDRESAQASEPYLREFLEMVVKQTGAKSVSIIAHSMGNQPLMDVLRDMRSSTPEGVEISQIVLAAPDVDADSFTNLARTIKGLAKNVTLYVASNDRALIVSRNFWGSYRAGDVPPAGPLIIDGIGTIDVTAASTDTFAINHSGYASNNKLLEDIGELLRTGLRPPEMRALKPGKITGPAGDYGGFTDASLKQPLPPRGLAAARKGLFTLTPKLAVRSTVRRPRGRTPVCRRVAMWCMRWQRLSVFKSLTSASWALAVRRLVPSIAFACLTVGSNLVLAPALLPAEAEELIEDGNVDDIGAVGEKGMPATNPRVKSLLAAHPREFVTICVAGCSGKPSIVQILPMPATARTGEMRTTAGSMGEPGKRGGADAAGFPPGRSECHRLRRRLRCPSGQGAIPLAGFADAAPADAAQVVEAGNEPLDIGR